MSLLLTAATGIALIVVLATRAGPVAAWSPIPVTPPEPSLQASAGVECLIGSGDPDVPLLIDQRRDVAVALFGERSEKEISYRTCTLIRTGEGWRQATTQDLSFTLLVVSGSVDERVLGSSVERVVIHADDRQVEVSYHTGFYLIWWPEQLALSGKPMNFLAADGSTLLEIPLDPP